MSHPFNLYIELKGDSFELYIVPLSELDFLIVIGGFEFGQIAYTSSGWKNVDTPFDQEVIDCIGQTIVDQISITFLSS